MGTQDTAGCIAVDRSLCVYCMFVCKFFLILLASELQSWLLYYSLPCLHGILPDKYLAHFACFVEGIYILLGDAITPTQLSRAKYLLCLFYKDYQALYGE